MLSISLKILSDLVAVAVAGARVRSVLTFVHGLSLFAMSAEGTRYQPPMPTFCGNWVNANLDSSLTSYAPRSVKRLTMTAKLDFLRAMFGSGLRTPGWRRQSI